MPYVEKFGSSYLMNSTVAADHDVAVHGTTRILAHFSVDSIIELPAIVKAGVIANGSKYFTGRSQDGVAVTSSNRPSVAFTCTRSSAILRWYPRYCDR